MKEHTFDRYGESWPSTVPPNFDDERTLITARRVVPLEKINARLRHRRRWLLGGAFAVAMMLGAASALLASYLRLRDVPQTVNEVSNVEVSPAEVMPAQVAVAAEATPEESPEVENVEELTPGEPEPEPVIKRRTTPRRPSVTVTPRNLPRMSEKDELERIREAVLYDEWQERRERRAIRRERRRQERYNNHRDLSNLDEIFEGRRRP